MEETIEQLKKTIEQLKKTMEKLKKTMENLKKIMDKPMKTMENTINTYKNHGKNPETSGEMDEQCKWEILATKCSKWEILAAKTKEGSLDDQKNKCKKKCQLNFAPLFNVANWKITNFYR